MTNLGLTPEDVSLVGTFGNFLGSRGVDPAGILGQTLRRQQDPLFASFAFNNLLNSGNANNAADRFGSFLGGGFGQGNRTAAGLFDRFQNNDFGGIAGTEDLLRGAAPGTETGGALENLARSGLRNNLSGSVASLFGNNLINNAQQGFEGLLADRTAKGQFSSVPRYDSYLAQQLGL